MAPARELPTPEQERELHRRLVERDPTAPADLAVAYLDHLIAWFRSTSARMVPDELCSDAAADAIIALAKNPSSYLAERGISLLSYLQMSARGDLLNSLRKDRRRRDCVELSPEVGNTLGCSDDPSVQMEIDEELTRALSGVLTVVREGLSDRQLEALDLLLQGERKTAEFARALGIDDLTPTEQRSEVKRFKDMVKNRIKRGRGDHDQPS